MEVCFRMADPSDLQEIMSIYRSLIGTCGCTWDEGYPDEPDVMGDIDDGTLYCMTVGPRIIGVASGGEDRELSDLACWSEKIKNPCFMARIGVTADMQGRGLAARLIEYITADVRKKGFDGIRFLVSKTNPPALALYKKLGFRGVGEVTMFGIDWFCYEKKI